MSLTPLDRAEKMIPLISLLYSSFLSNLIEEEILSFFVFSFLFPSKFPRNFSQILFSSLSFFLSRYECVCKERTKREGKRKPFFLSLDFSCFLPRLFLPSFLMSPFHECLAKEIRILPRCFTEAVEHNYTGILEGSFTPFASFARVRVTSFTDQLLLFFFFPLLPAKNLVRKCPSVVVKSNPDLISVHSRSFDFLYNLF